MDLDNLDTKSPFTRNVCVCARQYQYFASKLNTVSIAMLRQIDEILVL